MFLADMEVNLSSGVVVDLLETRAVGSFSSPNQTFGLSAEFAVPKANEKPPSVVRIILNLIVCVLFAITKILRFFY